MSARVTLFTRDATSASSAVAMIRRKIHTETKIKTTTTPTHTVLLFVAKRFPCKCVKDVIKNLNTILLRERLWYGAIMPDQGRRPAAILMPRTMEQTTSGLLTHWFSVSLPARIEGDGFYDTELGECQKWWYQGVTWQITSKNFTFSFG